MKGIKKAIWKARLWRSYPTWSSSRVNERVTARTTGLGHGSEVENLRATNFYVYVRCMAEAIMITQ
eukprot:5614190-Pyramimonas_sp.AAC.1